MLVDLRDALPGDAVEFKRHGLTAGILGGLLKLCDRKWDGWGWHLAIMWKKTEYGWTILQSTSQGVNKRFYPISYLEKNCRVYRWLESVPCRDKMGRFYSEHIGCKYDIGIYLWSGLQYLFRHFWNKRIPRLLDNRYTCWELVSEWFDFCGKRVQTIYDCPTINDILVTLKGK